jgi:hypothetical protein
MATTRVFQGVHREDWQDTSFVDGGTVVQIDTAIEIREAFQLGDVDVQIIIDEVIGSPVVSNITKSAVAGLLRVTFDNSAPAGNQLKWTAKIAYNHTIIR